MIDPELDRRLLDNGFTRFVTTSRDHELIEWKKQDGELKEWRVSAHVGNVYDFQFETFYHDDDGDLVTAHLTSSSVLTASQLIKTLIRNDAFN